MGRRLAHIPQVDTAVSLLLDCALVPVQLYMFNTQQNKNLTTDMYTSPVQFHLFAKVNPKFA